jgi:dCMP deaminase
VIEKDQYYLRIASTVALRSNCVGLQVGAVAVKGDRIVATGYNGTAAGLANCVDGGCTRCSDRDQFPSGTAYDLCVCVHAEANAVAMAARFGIALEGSILYVTNQPCFGCSKELLQVGVTEVFYGKTWKPDPRVKDDYEILQRELHSRRLLAPADPHPGDLQIRRP